MTAESQTGTVEKKLFIAAAPATVFAFFVDPDKMIQWMGTEATLEPNPGGLFRVNVTGANIARGEYVTVEPHSRVVFTWGWEGGEVLPPGQSQIEVTLTPRDGGTWLVMRHTGIPVDVAGRHDEGWSHYVARLEAVAAGRDPGPDTHLAQPAAADAGD